jgi:hypothetical protein
LQNRQADADISAALIELKEAAALPFRSHQEAFDFLAHGVEDVDRLLALQNVNAVYRYVKGDVGIYAKLRSRRNTHQCEFIFFRVPSDSDPAGTDDLLESTLANALTAEKSRRFGNHQWFKGKMFFGVSNLVEGPKGTIPSLVSIGLPKQRTDFRREVFAPASQIVSKIGFRAPEGEFDRFQGRTLGSHGGSVSSLVESGSKVVRGVEEDAREHLRQCARELDFVQILRGIRISINEFGPWLAFDEFVNDSIEITDVMLCADESQARAVEEIHLDQQRLRSDETANFKRWCGIFRRQHRSRTSLFGKKKKISQERG